MLYVIFVFERTIDSAREKAVTTYSYTLISYMYEVGGWVWALVRKFS